MSSPDIVTDSSIYSKIAEVYKAIEDEDKIFCLNCKCTFNEYFRSFKACPICHGKLHK